MNKFFLKLLCCVWVLLPPSPFSLLPSSSSSQQGVFSYVLWCRWFCRISHHCWLASHVILLLFFLSIVWVKFLGIVTISLTYSCSCTRHSLPHVPKYPVSWGTSTRGEYEQNFAISQSQNFLWVSVFKKKALIFDCSKILIFHTHPSPPAKIFVSLKCNAKIVKHALFSSHTLCVPLGANGSGHGSCCLSEPWSVSSINPRPPAHYLMLCPPSSDFPQNNCLCSITTSVCFIIFEVFVYPGRSSM